MKVLCPKEIASALGVSARTVTRLLNAGEIEGFRVGPKLWRSTNFDVEAYMMRRKLEERNARESEETFVPVPVAA